MALDDRKLETMPSGAGADIFGVDSSGLPVLLNNVKPGTNILELRNAANAQAFRVFNTYTDSSNYERLGVRWASNICRIGIEGAGTGSSARTLILETAGDLSVGTLTGSGSIFFPTNNTNRWQINNSGHFIASTTNAVDIGLSAGNKPRNGYFAGTLSFGTHSALGAESVTGYITVTDAGGTTRKLAVVS